MTQRARNDGKVLVWDLPTRLFHWLLVVLVICAYLSAEVFPSVEMTWHKLNGYALLGLLLFRLIWGFVGGRHARFLGFVKGPRALLRYLKGLGSRSAQPHGGHNPLGALSVLALLLCLAVQVVSGLFVDDEVLAQGPLAPLVESETRQFLLSVHNVNFNILLALIALHLVAILYYALWQRDDLVRPMVSGHKRLPPGEAGTSPPAWRALLVLALAAGAVALVVLGLPDWLPRAAGGNSWD